MSERGVERQHRLQLIKAAPVARTPLVTRPGEAAVAFAAAFAALVITHIPLLALPYYWDEAGYYVPAARDLLLSGSPIPHSTAVNPHPPLVMACVASAWKIAGYSPVVAHMAMLVFAAASIAAVYHLGRRVAHREVAAATAVLTAIYPVFFAQSTLVHLDVAAAAFTLWGLLFYLEDRKAACVIAFSLAALSKETAIVAPLALFAWEIVCFISRRSRRMSGLCAVLRDGESDSLFLLIPLGPLAGWFAFLYGRTGHVFGDPEFVRYNLTSTLSATRIGLALLQRLWQLFGHMDMYVLTAATALAMFSPALPEKLKDLNRRRVLQMPDESLLRQRIAIATQCAFGAVMLAYMVALSVLGGAVLTRYLLPVVPLWILICVSTLRRRVTIWKWVVGIVGAGFVAALFLNPVYRFAPEDNLAFQDMVHMHQEAARFIREKFGTPRVLTAWPASDELSRTWLGYVDQPLHVVRIENFAADQIVIATRRQDYDVALVFSTKYEPGNRGPLDWIPFWRRAHEQYFDYHQDLPPEIAARMLGGEIVFRERKQGQWVAVIAFNRVMNARNSASSNKREADGDL